MPLTVSKLAGSPPLARKQYVLKAMLCSFDNLNKSMI